MNAELIGIICGIIVGLLICVVIFRICNQDKKIKSEYDERQLSIRGRSYKYGFYTLLIYMAILVLYFMSDIKIPFVNGVLIFFGMALGIVVVAIHSIWENAYWGINNNRKKYYIIFGLCTLINLSAGIVAIANGTILEGFQGPMLNLICAIMLIILSITLFLKSKLTKDDTEEE